MRKKNQTKTKPKITCRRNSKKKKKKSPLRILIHNHKLVPPGICSPNSYYLNGQKIILSKECNLKWFEVGSDPRQLVNPNYGRATSTQAQRILIDKSFKGKTHYQSHWFQSTHFFFLTFPISEIGVNFEIQVFYNFCLPGTVGI